MRAGPRPAVGSALSSVPPSVLLVDDDANFRRALAIALRLDGLEVGEATTAAEARGALASRRFTAVLVDLMLQDGEAHALLERLCLGSDSRLAIACSPHPEALAAARDRIPGVAPLRKPFPSAELRRLIETGGPSGGR